MFAPNYNGFRIFFLCLLMIAGCSRQPAGPIRHYAITGKVIALDARHQSATIDAADIPGYMEAMTMEYPIKSKSDFAALHTGEQISGTLDVAADDTYILTNIKSK